MRIALPTIRCQALATFPLRHILSVVIVFALTLLLTVHFGNVLAGAFLPTTGPDPDMMREIESLSSAADADLESLGFVPDHHDAPVVPSAPSPSPKAGSPTVLPSPTLRANATVNPSATATATTTPALSPTATSPLPAWDRKGRVNILLMGLDGTASQGRYRRADSLIVASIDPATNSAVLIGIPRDLYVTINSPKGPIRNRINTAYVWGELYKYPGGGPALQMRTVSELLGIPIHNYVSVYFDGFAKLIDAIGGIDIDVPQAIRDNFTGWSFNKGMQHMDGKLALRYARSRYSTSDFSRGRRQQQVILAAVDKITKANLLPRLPVILPSVAESFRSDMSIPELLALASLGYRIDRSQIKTAQVDETMCQSWRTPDGAAVLLPKMDRIKAMVAAAMRPPAPATATPVPTTTSASDTSSAAASAYVAEQASVEVLNGTRAVGLARRTQTFLQGKGINVVRIGDAVGLYNETVLFHDGTKPATRDAVVSLLNIRPENVKPLPPGAVNVRVVLGSDARVP